jgi:hypothetical protein
MIYEISKTHTLEGSRVTTGMCYYCPIHNVIFTHIVFRSARLLRYLHTAHICKDSTMDLHFTN